jgi:hypothetical protein
MGVVGALVEDHNRETGERDSRRGAEQPSESLRLQPLREDCENHHQGSPGKPLDDQDQDVVDWAVLPAPFTCSTVTPSRATSPRPSRERGLRGHATLAERNPLAAIV